MSDLDAYQVEEVVISEDPTKGGWEVVQRHDPWNGDWVDLLLSFEEVVPVHRNEKAPQGLSNGEPALSQMAMIPRTRLLPAPQASRRAYRREPGYRQKPSSIRLDTCGKGPPVMPGSAPKLPTSRDW